MNPLDSVLNLGGKILDKIFPDANKAQEFKAQLLSMAQKGELDMLAAELKDRADARNLAAQDIAGGNNFTRFAAATVRPLWGYGAFVLVVWYVVTGETISTGMQSIVETVLYFYFGGRTVEKITPMVAEAMRK